MANKVVAEEELIGELKDGMTIGIGGWGSRRKPMSLVRTIARSGVSNLTVVSYGGPDVGILCAMGKVARVIYGFVSLDSIALDPFFRAARQNASVSATELDEGMLQWGLYAQALRLPFLPTRAGLGSDVMKINPWLKTVLSPYGDNEELVAVPAISLDLALVHVSRADPLGNGQILGVDPYFDDLYLMAAKRRVISCEEVIETDQFAELGSHHTLVVNRMMVDAVIEAPRGAHFSSGEPDYGRDETFQAHYAASAKSTDAWEAFRDRFVLAPSHESYLGEVDRFRSEGNQEDNTNSPDRPEEEAK